MSARTLALDGFIPDEPPNPWWLGDVQLHADCPDDGVYNAWVGREGFTGKTLDEWHTIEFTLTTKVHDALASSNACTIWLNLNAPSGGDPFVFDNMRFE